VGAGGEPVGHPPRPPIPIAAIDEDAARAARERLGTAGRDRLSELAAWLAGVAGDRAITVRLVLAGEARDELARVDAVRADPGIVPAGPLMSVAEVAHAVDAGRDLAARASAAGITVLATAATDDEAAARLAEALTDGAMGPLRALRREGTPEVAVLCGVALGAGEHGLGLVAAGPVALAGAAVAAGIEPDLRPRLLAAAPDPLAERLGLAVALATGHEPVDAALGAIALLRVADAARRS
jgi:hypothetical protein